MTDNIEIPAANVLPDGSAFMVGSLPLPKDHWLYAENADGFLEPPPMPFRMGTDDPRRQAFKAAVWAAAKYAVRASTSRGKDADFDPDALCMNMVVGLLGYHTADGLDPEPWGNPEPVPAPFPTTP